jgi:hypothetical protein
VRVKSRTQSFQNPKPVPLAAFVASFLPVSVPAAPWVPTPRIATLLVAWDAEVRGFLVPVMFAELETA